MTNLGLGYKAAWLAAAILVTTQGVTPRSAAAEGVSSSPKIIANLDLSKPFATRSAWRFIATQDASVPDPIYPEQLAPGAVHLCLRMASEDGCDHPLQAMAQPPPSVPKFWWEPHFLSRAQVVRIHQTPAPPLLLLQTAGFHSVDGDQAVYTQVFAYRSDADRFEPIYHHVTGRNRNEEDRLVTSGPLAGAVISVEPTENAPFGFWVTADALTPSYTYKQVLRYRSATRYNDGNTLAVIDSEMPNIQQRLGLWRPGSPLPLPARACPKPHLIHMELWCG